MQIFKSLYIANASLCHSHLYVLVPDKLETNWLNIKLKLLQSRQKVGYSNKPTTKYHIRDVFPDYNEGGFINICNNYYHILIKL